jgi:hypothetical protein
VNSKKLHALTSAGLVAAMVLGTAGMAYGATESTGPLFGTGARMGQAIRDAGARLVDIVAELTGLSVEEVQAERAEGDSAAEIAEANGVSAEELVSEALSARKEILDAKVADGTITQEQADAAYAQMSERVAERVTTEESGRPSWSGGSSSGRGSGAGACGGTCVVTQ